MKHLSDYNFFDPELLVCPYEFYKLAQAQAPIMELPSPKSDAKLFLVTRYDLVIEVLKNTKVFSSNFSTLLAGKEEQDDELQKIFAQGWPQMNTLLTADPPEHERFRSLVNKRIINFHELSLLITYVHRHEISRLCRGEEFVNYFN